METPRLNAFLCAAIPHGFAIGYANAGGLRKKLLRMDYINARRHFRTCPGFDRVCRLTYNDLDYLQAMRTLFNENAKALVVELTRCANTGFDAVSQLGRCLAAYV